MRNYFLAIIAIIFSASVSKANISDKVKLVGKIVAYDEKTVSLETGNQIVVLEKSSLKYPSYKAGETLEVEMTREEMKKLKSHKKSSKK